MKKIILIFFCLFIIGFFSFRYYQIKFDGILGELFGLILKTDTEYSPNYTDKDFAKIQTGMTENEVKGLIGKPFVAWKYDGKIIYEYSRSPGDTNYRMRQIHFSQKTKNVVEVKTEFYAD